MSGGGEGARAGARSATAIDDAGYRPFHTRLLTYSCGGPFCDGYVLGIIAIALPSLAVSLQLDRAGRVSLRPHRCSAWSSAAPCSATSPTG